MVQLGARLTEDPHGSVIRRSPVRSRFTPFSFCSISFFLSWKEIPQTTWCRPIYLPRTSFNRVSV
ncbi:hypothetical protein BJX96DRAFT_155235 [Aspergillus floccosus]